MPYTGAVQSAAARAVEEQQRRQLAAMTPADRVTLAVRLSEEGLASFMATHRLDRRTALARIRATRRLGRRPSASADADDD